MSASVVRYRQVLIKGSIKNVEVRKKWASETAFSTIKMASPLTRQRPRRRGTVNSRMIRYTTDERRPGIRDSSSQPSSSSSSTAWHRLTPDKPRMQIEISSCERWMMRPVINGPRDLRPVTRLWISLPRRVLRLAPTISLLFFFFSPLPPLLLYLRGTTGTHDRGEVGISNDALRKFVSAIVPAWIIGW